MIESPLSWLMLVVTLGKVVFTRCMSPAEDFVNVVQCWYRGRFLHLPNLDLDLAGAGKSTFSVGRKTPFS
jgi:hypothetical protein